MLFYSSATFFLLVVKRGLTNTEHHSHSLIPRFLHQEIPHFQRHLHTTGRRARCPNATKRPGSFQWFSKRKRSDELRPTFPRFLLPRCCSLPSLRAAHPQNLCFDCGGVKTTAALINALAGFEGSLLPQSFVPSFWPWEGRQSTL